jgi:15-cis-phytoene synthase
LTRSYSTSFSMASSLFPKRMQPHIFAIYGLVRIADEIVDTYRGKDAARALETLEKMTYDALTSGYSTNITLQAFQMTARKFGIDKSLIQPFFSSMRMDLDLPPKLSEEQYNTYIYGSAEVVGLMCLKVFCNNNKQKYQDLAPGAKRLGAAYQKVNFLRDIASDFDDLGRFYFPDTSMDQFNDRSKHKIEQEISADFEYANHYIKKLPTDARRAVRASYMYYFALLKKIESTPADLIKQHRIRISNPHKVFLLGRAWLGLAA